MAVHTFVTRNPEFVGSREPSVTVMLEGFGFRQLADCPNKVTRKMNSEKILNQVQDDKKRGGYQGDSER